MTKIKGTAQGYKCYTVYYSLPAGKEVALGFEPGRLNTISVLLCWVKRNMSQIRIQVPMIRTDVTILHCTWVFT